MGKRKYIAGALVALGMAVFSGGNTFAAGNTCTWTGTAGDNKFATAGNWTGTGCTTGPQTGDSIVFDASDSVPVSIDNTGVTTALAGVKLTGTSSKTYTLSSSLNLATNATWESAPIGSSGPMIRYSVNTTKTVAQGNISVLKGFSPDITMPNGGVVTGKDTSLISYAILQSGATGIVVENGSAMPCMAHLKDYNVTVPITLGGGSGANAPMIGFGVCTGGVSMEDPALTLMLAKVTLASDAKVSVFGNDTVKVVDLIKNGHSLTLDTAGGSDGTLVTPDGAQTVTYEQKTTKLDGDKPTEDVLVNPNETAILNGSRCWVSVKTGGILKGMGKLCGLSVSGTVSPGNSPGTITITNELSLAPGSTYAMEVLAKDNYDQIISKGAFINNALLDVKYLPGAKVAAGDTYTIISNTDTQPVSGTFKDLPEGATFSAMGGTFKISYKGGDGNDVTVAVVSVPKVPNTGFEVMKSNTGLIALAGIAIAGALAVFARRLQKQ